MWGEAYTGLITRGWRFGVFFFQATRTRLTLWHSSLAVYSMWVHLFIQGIQIFSTVIIHVSFDKLLFVSGVLFLKISHNSLLTSEGPFNPPYLQTVSLLSQCKIRQDSDSSCIIKVFLSLGFKKQTSVTVWVCTVWKVYRIKEQRTRYWRLSRRTSVWRFLTLTVFYQQNKGAESPPPPPHRTGVDASPTAAGYFISSYSLEPLINDRRFL